MKDGEKHGQGTDTQADRMKYVGETKNGKYHGQGTKTWSEGTKYVGEFKDGKRHGQGTVTWTDGLSTSVNGKITANGKAPNTTRTVKSLLPIQRVSRNPSTNGSHLTKHTGMTHSCALGYLPKSR